MSMIDLAKKKEEIHGRLVQYLLQELLVDGGKRKKEKKYKLIKRFVFIKVNGACWSIWSINTVSFQKPLFLKVRRPKRRCK